MGYIVNTYTTPTPKGGVCMYNQITPIPNPHQEPVGRKNMVYVDEARWPWKGQLWCHLAADSLDELHDFARKIGLKRQWFQEPPKTRYPHYDLNANRRVVAVKRGAVEITGRELLGYSKLLRVEYDHLAAVAAILAPKRPRV